MFFKASGLATLTPPPSGGDRLGIALVVATALHGALLFGVGFDKSSRHSSATNLEITLAQHRDRQSPLDVQHLAAHNQLASGDSNESHPVTSDQVALLDSTELKEVDPLPEPMPANQSPLPPRETLLSHGADTLEAPLAPSADTLSTSPHAQPQRVREIANLRARLDQQKQAYSKLPRTLVLTSVSARSSDQAEYLYNWIDRVERVGNQHYPQEARRKALFGELRMAVAIGRDGGVEAIEILQGSGQRVLDQAAVRTVRLAAPFAPIPPALGVDRIEVIRTWRFVPGQAFSTRSE